MSVFPNDFDDRDNYWLRQRSIKRTTFTVTFEFGRRKDKSVRGNQPSDVRIVVRDGRQRVCLRPKEWQWLREAIATGKHQLLVTDGLSRVLEVAWPCHLRVTQLLRTTNEVSLRRTVHFADPEELLSAVDELLSDPHPRPPCEASAEVSVEDRMDCS